ncbi:tubulin polymerization-promoting protein [Striga asiatica]|uniref:Tubulin polymerization-promoting protein n=1 Tax=Striga asiatica TaxID=4170 RepID=A0A5A7R301_STRAF|nr:tubulin polymerization-promoting protein [Striga asiatica]
MPKLSEVSIERKLVGYKKGKEKGSLAQLTSSPTLRHLSFQNSTFCRILLETSILLHPFFILFSLALPRPEMGLIKRRKSNDLDSDRLSRQFSRLVKTKRELARSITSSLSSPFASSIFKPPGRGFGQLHRAFRVDLMPFELPTNEAK